MRAINHALTGAVVGLTIADPLVAAPLAFASHYVMDALPHSNLGPKGKITKGFILQVVIDAFLCIALVLVLLINRPIHWLTAVVCAFLAAFPDFLSINYFHKTLKKLPYRPNLYSRFAQRIQWFERPLGLIVEAVWLVSFVFCLSIFLHR